MTADATVSPRRRLFTVDEYERMGAAGILGANDRVELLDGEIVEMSPIGPPHAGIVNRLNRLLIQRVADAAVVTVQNPLRIVPRSEPQPDFVVARPRADDYQLSHPEPNDVLLVIEVADTSLAVDYGVKTSLYARAGVPEYWILDIAGRRVITHAAPVHDAYQDVQVAEPGSSITLRGAPRLSFTVSEILTPSG